MESSDNIGNLSLCVQAYTNYNLDLEKKYNNGKSSKILYTHLKEGKINTDIKKDYFFLVCNKKIKGDIIINSILGLSKLSGNNNNLPFQVKWNNNRQYNLGNISNKVEIFIETIKRANKPWIFNFLEEIYNL